MVKKLERNLRLCLKMDRITADNGIKEKNMDMACRSGKTIQNTKVSGNLAFRKAVVNLPIPTEMLLKVNGIMVF